MPKPVNTPPKLQGEKPEKAVQEELAIWQKHLVAEVQKEPERLEGAAKFLVGIISISLTIFITNRPDGLGEWTGTWLSAAMGLWLLAAVFGFLVLFPWRYKYNKDSIVDLKNAHKRIVDTKRMFLLMSVICFLFAMGFGVYVFLSAL